MEYDKYYKMVEDVLDKYPLECRCNYYNNKSSLIINIEEYNEGNIYGEYLHEDNIITLYIVDSLGHELFHMAFRDIDKVGKKIYEDNNLFYSNGVSFYKLDGDKKIICGRGITEGFAEYLFRKCINKSSNITGKRFEYYFMDLLISIYGEDIIWYALKNDPVGFYEDKRFNDIFELSSSLDELESLCERIRIFVMFKDVYEEILASDDEDEKRKLSRILFDTRNRYKECIVELFELIINEYNNSNNPCIDRDGFYSKLKVFVEDEYYQLAFGFDDLFYSVRDNVNNLIKKFSRDNKKIRKLRLFKSR